MHQIDPFVDNIKFIKDDLKHLPRTANLSPKNNDFNENMKVIIQKRKVNKLEKVFSVTQKPEKERIQDQCENLARLQKLMEKPQGY